jgi:hypothetical protein
LVILIVPEEVEKRLMKDIFLAIYELFGRETLFLSFIVYMSYLAFSALSFVVRFVYAIEDLDSCCLYSFHQIF